MSFTTLEQYYRDYRVKNGQVLNKFFDEDMMMLLDDNDELVAIYRQDRDSDKVRAYKVF